MLKGHGNGNGNGNEADFSNFLYKWIRHRPFSQLVKYFWFWVFKSVEIFIIENRLPATNDMGKEKSPTPCIVCGSHLYNEFWTKTLCIGEPRFVDSLYSWLWAVNDSPYWWGWKSMIHRISDTWESFSDVNSTMGKNSSLDLKLHCP